MRSFFRNWVFSFFFLGSLLLNGALWTLFLVRIGVGEGMIVLRYNVYFGIDLTGSSWQASLIPLVATVFWGMNVFLAFLFHRKKIFLPSLLLLVASFFVQVAALIALLALVSVN